MAASFLTCVYRSGSTPSVQDLTWLRAFTVGSPIFPHWLRLPRPMAASFLTFVYRSGSTPSAMVQSVQASAALRSVPTVRWEIGRASCRERGWGAGGGGARAKEHEGSTGDRGEWQGT